MSCENRGGAFGDCDCDWAFCLVEPAGAATAMIKPSRENVKRLLADLHGEGYPCEIFEDHDGKCWFVGDLDIDADGSPHAYHPVNSMGVDDIRNAKDKAGNFVGVLTDKQGRPLVQGADDPAPGYYISPTTLILPGFSSTSQRQFVNAEKVPFIVVPPQAISLPAEIVMGCAGRLTHLLTGEKVDLLVADKGPKSRAGEASMQAAKRMGIGSNPRSGGEDEPHFLYEFWPGRVAVVDGVTYPLQSSRRG